MATDDMSNQDTPTSNQIAQSLKLLRSGDPADRRRAIEILAAVRGDPRVQKVFEHLYQSDPDPQVRQAAWQALSQTGPSVPAPGGADDEMPPEAPPARPAPARRVRPAAEAPSGAPRPGGRLFLLNPANAEFVAKEGRRTAQRRRRARGGGCAFTVVAGLVLLVTILLWALAAPYWYRWYRFRWDGVTADGAITGQRVSDVDESYVIVRDEFYVSYRFETGAGDQAAPYEDEQRVTEDAYESLAPDTPVRVTYLPDDPATSQLEVETFDEWARKKFTIAAGGLTIVFVLLALLRFVKRRRARRAWQSGGVLPGQVVTCSGALDDEGDFKIKLHYRFRSPAGRVIEGHLTQIRNDLQYRPLPPAGTPVAVYYRNDKSYRLM